MTPLHAGEALGLRPVHPYPGNPQVTWIDELALLVEGRQGRETGYGEGILCERIAEGRIEEP